MMVSIRSIKPTWAGSLRRLLVGSPVNCSRRSSSFNSRLRASWRSLRGKVGVWSMIRLMFCNLAQAVVERLERAQGSTLELASLAGKGHDGLAVGWRKRREVQRLD